MQIKQKKKKNAEERSEATTNSQHQATTPLPQCSNPPSPCAVQLFPPVQTRTKHPITPFQPNFAAVALLPKKQREKKAKTEPKRKKAFLKKKLEKKTSNKRHTHRLMPPSDLQVQSVDSGALPFRGGF
jgi:hypothetical protein